MKLFATIFFAITINSCSAWISFFENYIIYIFKAFQLQNSNNYDRTIYQCRAYGASFGGVLSDGRLTGCLIPTVPPDACSTVARPPSFNSTITCHSPIALIIRGNCSFALKVLNAQKANYKSAVIYNDVLDPTIDVMYDDEAQSGTEIYIPSFLVNNHCGRELFNRYTVQKGNYIIQIKTIWTDYDIVRYLLPFVAVVGLCFFAMVISMMLKLVRDRRRHMRRRLTTQSLKKIPIKKYKKYDIPETCAICLEDFIEGEKLRVLPCSHWYHVNCIDPWLTRSRKDCPICKRRVNPEHPETSDSETDDSAERRPLLQTSNGNRNGFTRNYNTADAVPVHVSDGPSLEQNLEPAQPIGRVSGAVNNAFLDEIPSSSRNN